MNDDVVITWREPSDNVVMKMTMAPWFTLEPLYVVTDNGYISHSCKLNPEVHDGYGVAIDSHIYLDDGKWMAGNGEYGSQVFFCPWCGLKLEEPK